MNSFNEVFDAIKDYCRQHVVAASYTLFIDGIEPVDFSADTATLSVRSEFLQGVVNDRYIPLMKEAFRAILGFDVQIKLVVAVEAAPAAQTADPAPALREDPEQPPAQGSYALTFENFIVGSTNKFAHAAAQAVAANPSGAYNPLFIYGGSGLGKTHLLKAIQIEIGHNHPDFNLVYVDGEKFTNEIINAIREGSTEEFHQKYRAADVLLVDDIQFIGGKESTQEEFFHTFNTLYQAGKQIVLASDRPPKEIKSLEDRLRTRFEWGLTADIQPPDFETRVAIIRRKADLLGLEIPDEVAEFIASHLKDNIRQLEGAVKKLNAYHMLEGIQPVLGVAQNAIKDILNETQPVPVTVSRIITEVARTYNISADEIRGRKRTANVSAARRTAMYVVREITGMSMEDIGREFGGRDHSTIVYSLNEAAKSIENGTRIRETVEDIIKNIRS